MIITQKFVFSLKILEDCLNSSCTRLLVLCSFYVGMKTEMKQFQKDFKNLRFHFDIFFLSIVEAKNVIPVVLYMYTFFVFFLTKMYSLYLNSCSKVFVVFCRNLCKNVLSIVQKVSEIYHKTIFLSSKKSQCILITIQVSIKHIPKCKCKSICTLKVL